MPAISAEISAVAAPRPWRNRLVLAPAGMVGAVLVAVVVLGCALGPFVWTLPYDNQSLADAFVAPGAAHPLGTDNLGRDLLARVLAGGRLSIVIGITTAVAGLAVGTLLGCVAALSRGLLESALLRLIEALLALPGIVQAIIFVAVIGRGAGALIVALSIYSVPIFARIAYSATRQVMAEGYYKAGTALGATAGQNLFRHVLPNIAPPLLTLTTMRVGTNTLTAASLNFFGVGVQPPTAEWGLMVAEASSYSWEHPLLIIVPGAALLALSLGTNLFGEALRSQFDVKIGR